MFISLFSEGIIAFFLHNACLLYLFLSSFPQLVFSFLRIYLEVVSGLLCIDTFELSCHSKFKEGGRGEREREKGGGPQNLNVILYLLILWLIILFSVICPNFCIFKLLMQVWCTSSPIAI